MTPKLLILQAFGPYAGEVRVDFDQLPAEAIFLIHGPTGAGKSSLLDGICYALYGDTSGGERQAKDLRSHHADAATPTVVVFDFVLGGRRWRIRRAPEQELAGRGGRMSRKPAQASLEELCDGQWLERAGRASEVTAKVVALLGFEAEQFRQVILLPQGQFRRLLAASSREREALLETLFASVACKRLQEALAEARRALQAQADRLEERRAALLLQTEASSEAALDAWLEAQRQQLAELAMRETTLRQRLDAAQQALSEGEALAARFAEAKAAKEALANLEADEAAMAEQRQRLGAARRAFNVLPNWRALVQARQWRAEAESERSEAEAAQKRAEAAWASATAALAIEQERKAERQAAAAEVLRLQSLRTAAMALEQAEAACQEARQQEAKAAAEEGRRAAQLQAVAGKIDVVTAHCARLAPLAERLSSLLHELEKLGARQTMLTRARQAEAELAASQKQLQTLSAQRQQIEARLAEAQEALETLQTHWQAAQSALLARHLRDGQPCPVCGSREHPAPARSQQALPSETQIEAAQVRLKQEMAALAHARAAEQEAANKVSSISTALQERRAALELPADVPLPDWAAGEAALATLRQKVEEARQAGRELGEYNDSLSLLQQQRLQVEQALAAAQQTLAEARAARVGHEAVCAERAAQLPEALRSPGTLERQLAALQTKQAQLEAALHQAQETSRLASEARAAAQARACAAHRAVQAADERCQSASDALAEALHRQGFADEAAFIDACCDEEALAALEARLQRQDEALAAARARLARAQGAIAGVQMPDLAALRAGRAQAQADVEAIQGQRQQLQTRLAERERCRALLAELAAEAAQLKARYRATGHLADVAGGNNAANLTFQRWVLAALLDDVLHQASLRLHQMSAQRYTLQRAQAVSDRRRAAGLDIEVFDAYTGLPRSAQTLSGGEGFLASLALALGLADVVQSYAGGIELDMLFIDEGFGTLDAEALDMALRALLDLGQGGRRVGIISHVEELKRQIAWGIEVSAGAAGSQVRVGRLG